MTCLVASLDLATLVSQLRCAQSHTHICFGELLYILLVQLTYVTSFPSLTFTQQSVGRPGFKLRIKNKSRYYSGRCRASDGVVSELSGREDLIELSSQCKYLSLNFTLTKKIIIY